MLLHLLQAGRSHLGALKGVSTMARTSLLVSAATAVALLSGQAALAQLAYPIEPHGPYSVTFHSLDDPSYQVRMPLDAAQSMLVDCRLDEIDSIQQVALIFGEVAGASLPEGTYTVTVDLPSCQGSATFAHTSGSTWFATFPGPHDGRGDSGQDGGDD